MAIMLHIVTFGSALLGLISAPGPVAPALATSKWVVEFEEDRCTAGRSYSDGSNEFAIGIEPKPTSSYTTIILQMPKTVDGLSFHEALVSLGSAEWQKKSLISEPSVRAGQSRFRFAVKRSEIEQLVTEPRLRIDMQRDPHIEVRLDDFGALLRTLAECEAGLLDEWGFSRAQQASLASYPESKGSVFDGVDYPRRALSRGAVGTIGVAANVDAEGKPVDCRITRSSGHKDLDEITCRRIMARGRFEPARDLAGKAVPAISALQVNWLLND